MTFDVFRLTGKFMEGTRRRKRVATNVLVLGYHLRMPIIIVVVVVVYFFIRKIYLGNIGPRNVCDIFLIFAQKQDCGKSLGPIFYGLGLK